MSHFLNPRHAACCLAVVFSLNMVFVERTYAQSTFIIPNSRHTQAPVKPVERGSVASTAPSAASVDDGRGTTQASTADSRSALVALPNERAEEGRTAPPASLNALIEDGQLLSPLSAGNAVGGELHGDAGHLQLATAVRQAITSYPDIRRANEEVNEQLQRVEVARAGYFPRISGGIRTGYQSDAPGSGGAQVFDLSATQMLYDFGKVASTVKTSQANVVERQAQVGLSIEQIALNTAQAFLDSQLYQRLISIAREQIESLKNVSDLARQRFDMGASTRSDYVQTVSRIEAAKVSELQHQVSLARSLATLANLTGNSAVTGVADSFPRVVEQSCVTVEMSAKDNPGVIAAQARVEKARAEITAARAAGLPTLSVEPTFTQQLDGDPGVNQDRSRYSVFLNASMPIYQGGAIQAGKAASERALASAQAALDTARLNARQELQQAKSQVLKLHSSLTAQSQRERTIDETRVLYREQYLELGTRPLLDLLNAEQEAYLSRVEQQSTLNTLRRLQLTCLYSVGQLSRSLEAGGNNTHRERLP